MPPAIGRPLTRHTVSQTPKKIPQNQAGLWAAILAWSHLHPAWAAPAHALRGAKARRQGRSRNKGAEPSARARPHLL